MNISNADSCSSSTPLFGVCHPTSAFGESLGLSMLKEYPVVENKAEDSCEVLCPYSREETFELYKKVFLHVIDIVASFDVWNWETGALRISIKGKDGENVPLNLVCKQSMAQKMITTVESNKNNKGDVKFIFGPRRAVTRLSYFYVVPNDKDKKKNKLFLAADIQFVNKYPGYLVKIGDDVGSNIHWSEAMAVNMFVHTCNVLVCSALHCSTKNVLSHLDPKNPTTLPFEAIWDTIVIFLPFINKNDKSKLQHTKDQFSFVNMAVCLPFLPSQCESYFTAFYSYVRDQLSTQDSVYPVFNFVCMQSNLKDLLDIVDPKLHTMLVVNTCLSSLVNKSQAKLMPLDQEGRFIVSYKGDDFKNCVLSERQIKICRSIGCMVGLALINNDTFYLGDYLPKFTVMGMLGWKYKDLKLEKFEKIIESEEKIWELLLFMNNYGSLALFSGLRISKLLTSEELNFVLHDKEVSFIAKYAGVKKDRDNVVGWLSKNRTKFNNYCKNYFVQQYIKFVHPMYEMAVGIIHVLPAKKAEQIWEGFSETPESATSSFESVSGSILSPEKIAKVFLSLSNKRPLKFVDGGPLTSKESKIIDSKIVWMGKWLKQADKNSVEMIVRSLSGTNTFYSKEHLQLEIHKTECRNKLGVLCLSVNKDDEESFVEKLAQHVRDISCAFNHFLCTSEKCGKKKDTVQELAEQEEQETYKLWYSEVKKIRAKDEAKKPRDKEWSLITHNESLLDPTEPMEPWDYVSRPVSLDVSLLNKEFISVWEC